MEDARELTPEEPLPIDSAEQTEAPAEPLEPAPPISSRFLYVDVAAQRAKQLRRGARVRYDIEPGVPAHKKPERIAMEEVKRCLVQYTVPPWRGRPAEEQQA
jgi:DNA-directed RNA polymerase omega subunit